MLKPLDYVLRLKILQGKLKDKQPCNREDFEAFLNALSRMDVYEEKMERLFCAMYLSGREADQEKLTKELKERPLLELLFKALHRTE